MQNKLQRLLSGEYVQVYDKSLVLHFAKYGMVISEQQEGCFLCHIATDKEQKYYYKKLGYKNTGEDLGKFLAKGRVLWI